MIHWVTLTPIIVTLTLRLHCLNTICFSLVVNHKTLKASLASLIPLSLTVTDWAWCQRMTACPVLSWNLKLVCSALFTLGITQNFQTSPQKVLGHSHTLQRTVLVSTHWRGLLLTQYCFQTSKRLFCLVNKETCSVVSGDLRWATSKGTPQSGVNGKKIPVLLFSTAQCFLGLSQYNPAPVHSTKPVVNTPLHGLTELPELYHSSPHNWSSSF